MKTDVTTIYNLKVYTESGVYIGKVNDIVIDLKKRQVAELGLVDINKSIHHDVSTPGIFVPYRLVISIGDIIIVKDIISRSKPKSVDIISKPKSTDVASKPIDVVTKPKSI